MPSIDHWTDFKTYPPNARTEASDPSGLKGSRFFEQVVIPQNSEMDVLPPLVFSYFNPMEGPITRSSTLPWLSKCLPIPRRHLFPVLRSRGSLKPVFQSPGLRTLFPSSPFWLERGVESTMALNTVFYWVQSIPVVLLGMLVLGAKWRDSQTKNPIKQRKRQVDQWLKAQYPQLESLAQKGDGNSF